MITTNIGSNTRRDEANMNDERSFVEYILALMNTPETEYSHHDHASKARLPNGADALPEAQDMRFLNQIQQFTDEMPGGFFIYRADGDEEILYANQALVRMFGCDTMEEFRQLTANSFRGIVHPDDLEQVEESIKEQITHSQFDLDYVEYRIRQKDGTIRWIEDYGHFLHIEEVGDFFYVFVGDATEKRQRILEEKDSILTEKKQAEEKLQNQIDAYSQELMVINQEQLRRLELIEGLSIDYEAIFYVNLDANRIKSYRVNDWLEESLGQDRQVRGFLGYNDHYIHSLVCPEDRDMVKKASCPEYIREQLTKNRTFHLNYRIIKEKKTEYRQLRTVNVGEEGHISQIVVGYRNVDGDIRHEIERQRILEHALKQAQLANIAKNAFLANMSHDIRTPMNAIFGFTSLAKSHVDDKAKVLNYLEQIHSSSQLLLSLINNVLELSRTEAADVQIEETVCNLIQLIQEIRALVLPQIEKKEMTLDLELGDVDHPDVYADFPKLRQILLYLLDNAIKYTPPGGRIQITLKELTKSSNNYASYQIIVEDNGIGISKEFLKHIFEPFERQENTTLSNVQGAGLGLTITKNIVDIMGGTIQVESAAGKGSRFLVTLSLRLQDEPDLPPENSRALPDHLPNPFKILLVEDNELNLEIEEELLKDAGFEVETAKNGQIAVEKVMSSQPGDYALILMDIQMPVMDGHLAARAIRNLDDPNLSAIPIIALSANAFDEDKKKSLASGMNAHMAKPMNLSELLSQIEELIP